MINGSRLLDAGGARVPGIVPGLAGGASCGHDYLCVAKKGYDAPTGLGSPDGIGAF